jgi:hypothetical protein
VIDDIESFTQFLSNLLVSDEHWSEGDKNKSGEEKKEGIWKQREV